MKSLLFFLFMTGAQASVLLTEESIQTLYKVNPEIKSLRERLEASEKLRGSLTRSFLPKVELSYGREKYSTGPYDQVNQHFGGIQASINIFNSGKDSLENDKRELSARISEIDSVMIEAQIMAQIRKDMAEFAYLVETEKILQEAFNSNDSHFKAAQKRVNAGLSAKTDTLDFQQQTISLKQQLTQIGYEKGVVSRMIATLLGIDPSTEIEINFVNDHPEHSDSLTKNVKVENAILIKQSMFLAEMANLEMKQAYRWWAPSVDVYGFAMRALQKDREYRLPEQRNDAGIGFRIVLPIFDGGESYRVAQSKAAIERSQKSQVEAKKLAIQRDIQDTAKKLDLTHELIHGAEENVSLITKYRQGIMSEYSRGVKNSPDVLQANNRWIQASLQYSEIKRNYQSARAEALYLYGITTHQ
jgi:outer membrane protein